MLFYLLSTFFIEVQLLNLTDEVEGVADYLQHLILVCEVWSCLQGNKSHHPHTPKPSSYLIRGPQIFLLQQYMHVKSMHLSMFLDVDHCLGHLGGSRQKWTKKVIVTSCNCRQKILLSDTVGFISDLPHQVSLILGYVNTVLGACHVSGLTKSSCNSCWLAYHYAP